MLRKAEGNMDSYDIKKMKKQSMAVTAFTKFFVAQRSLFYFQFESPFEWARQMVHEFAVPMLLEKWEKMGAQMGASLVKAPPSPEVIDAIIDAIGNISGSTIGALKARLLSDRIPIPGQRHSDPVKTVFGHLKERMRLDACLQEAAKEDGDQQAKMVTSLSLPCSHSLSAVRALVYGTCCLLIRRQRQEICTYSHTHYHLYLCLML